jgi:hypothetical protein
MHPKKFIAKWGLNSDQVARLTRRSKSVVDHWLVDETKSSYKQPPREVKDFLGTVDVVWMFMKSAEQSLPKQVANIYKELIDDGEDKDI